MLNRRRIASLGAGEQMRALEQAAEIFFAGDLLRAFLVAEVGHGFVFHFQPFEAHDADVFPVFFPDLALAQFHGVTIPAV